jgi:hypothetical protein
MAFLSNFHLFHLLFCLIVVIILNIPIWLDYKLPDNYSKLCSSVNSDEMKIYYIGAIIISMPMCFDLLLDLAGSTFLLNDRYTIVRRKLGDLIREWITKLLFIYSLVMPNILSLGIHDSSLKATAYYCQNSMQNCLTLIAFLFDVSNHGDPIWNWHYTSFFIFFQCISQILGTFAVFSGNYPLEVFAFSIYMVNSFSIAVLFLFNFKAIIQKILNRPKDQDIMTNLTLSDLIIITYGSSLFSIFLVSQSYASSVDEIFFSNSSVGSLKVYIMSSSIFVILVTVIPGRLSRYDLSRTKVFTIHILEEHY